MPPDPRDVLVCSAVFHLPIRIPFLGGALHPDIGKALMFLSFKALTFIHEGAQEPLFQNCSFTVGNGWTGIVGPNGVGKTTLLRLALGELRPAGGQIRNPGQGLHCPQRTDCEPGGLRDLLMDPGSSAQRLKHQLGLLPDWADRWETLSHGERKRAQVAVMLHQAPAFLAVDEPTNHLDQETRHTVWQALKGFRGIGLLVSHDRDLLDDLCDQCLFLDTPHIILRPGGYSDGRRQVEAEKKARARERAKADREVDLIRKEMLVRREQTAKAERQRSKRGIPKGDHDAKGRVNAARVADSGSGQRLRQLEGRLNQATERMEGIQARHQFARGVTLGGTISQRRILLFLPGQEIPLGDLQSLKIPALVVHPGDRIGITGPNGAGKSTLIRRMVADPGLQGLRVAYLPQEIDVRNCQAILEDFRNLPPDLLGRAMTVVRRLGSDPALLLQSLEPSPGEIRKLLLAGSIGSDPHLIVLDEPTNHLDLPSIECLEQALGAYPAALVMVSHDRRFLGNLVQREWNIQPSSNGWTLEEIVADGYYSKVVIR